MNAFYITELALLSFFCCEIVIHLTAFGGPYIRNFWNILDVLIIATCIAFVILEFHI